MARTRRNFTAEFNAKVVLEIISGNKSAAEACREYNLKPDLVSRWSFSTFNWYEKWELDKGILAFFDGGLRL